MVKQTSFYIKVVFPRRSSLTGNEGMTIILLNNVKLNFKRGTMTEKKQSASLPSLTKLIKILQYRIAHLLKTQEPYLLHSFRGILELTYLSSTCSVITYHSTILYLGTVMNNVSDKNKFTNYCLKTGI